VFGCGLFTVIGAVGTDGFAQSVSPQLVAAASSDLTKTKDAVPKRALDTENDSSSEIANPPASSSGFNNTLGPQLLKNLAEDQKAIWTSPGRVRLIDADWLVPLGVFAGGLLATDTEFSKHLSTSPSRLRRSNDFSNYGIASLAGASAGLYVWGHIAHDDHKRETGFLAAEAAIDSLAATYATKYAFERERPLQDDFRGRFWQGGDSFPSEHAAAAWSIASVIAHEYPGPLTSLFAYGLASGISASRVTAKQHFPTDVLVGSAVGWFVGQEVYRHHHDAELGGGDWQTYAESREQSPSRRSTTSAGSPYVELDSWVYPAIDRLAALGYIHSEFLGMRPWTRIECAQLMEEAGDAIRADESVPDEADRLYTALVGEFRRDLDGLDGDGESSARLESIYTTATGISGTPLHDSYHFGQTIINDYGRPYEEGFNTYDGFSSYGTAGRFTIYVRGEYQHAPSAPAYSLAARQAIASADVNPLQAATPFATVDQFRLLDTYVSAHAANWDLSFGKQSLWWGPGAGGSLAFSDNAEPIYMFRASRVAPFQLPWVFSKMGQMKVDYFFGKLSGNEFPARPLIHGTKVSFKPTRYLELGFTAMSELGGVGRALTPVALFRSYFSLHSSDTFPADANPGKRWGGFDFSYRVPRLRNWLTLYSELYSPQDNPTQRDTSTGIFLLYYRLVQRSGIYMPRLPGLSKLDFRTEAVYTDPPTPRSNAGRYMYFNDFYHDLHTNKGNILGDWIGREGMGFQSWSTYHFDARTSLQILYRHAKVAKDFIPDGETMNDAAVKVDWWVHDNLSLSGSVQYEKWLAPILAPSPQTNWTTSVQLAFYPHSWGR